MKTCSECGRPLNEGENDLCPACESTKSHKKKRWGEIIGGVVTVAAGIVIAVLTGGKGGGKA